jgi:peptide deformylase
MEIKKYPDPILRKKTALISKVTEQELSLFERMAKTMYRFKGIGLAAPQVGILQRLIVADTGSGIVKLANPLIIRVSGSDRMVEGCLSIPEASVEIERPFEALISGFNERSQKIEIRARGLLARVLLHEIDHLNGRLIIDYLGFLKKMRFRLKKH